MNAAENQTLTAANAADSPTSNLDHSAKPGLSAATLASGWSAPTPNGVRRVFGGFATGVTVIGARSAEGALVGMTANSFTSVSLNPPLVLFCASKSLVGFRVYDSAPHFSVNILSEDAKSVSGSFARSGAEKWSTVPHSVGETGVPFVLDALVSLECEVVARHDAGDHIIVVGHVLRMRHSEGGEPLIFYASRYRRLEPHRTEEGEASDDVSFLIWG